MATPGSRPTGRRAVRPPGKSQGKGENLRIGKQTNQKGSKTKLCRFIEHGKKCPYGEDCTYSHDTSSIRKDQVKRSSDSPKEQQERAYYNSWKRIIKYPPKQNDIATIKRLWTGALDILNGFDRNWKQMLPRDLDSDDNLGREHIHTLLSMKSYGTGYQTFVELSQPFLSVITHPAMLDCLSIDTAVGGLYNFISGTNGQRAIEFFTRLCSNLTNAYGQSVISISVAEDTLTVMGVALQELLKREQRAVYHDELPELVNSLEKAANALGLDTKPIIFQASVAEIKARVGRATGLLKVKEIDHPATIDGISTTVVKSSYPRPVVVPGTRHDNDHVDITKIRIMPTDKEICCDLPDYLPTTDRDQPSFITDATGRHIDTLFRLLRHDIFGELKYALGILVRAMTEDENLQRNWKLPIGDIRAYTYPNAHVRYISFERKIGIEAQVSFSQLPALRKKTPDERFTNHKEDFNLSMNEYNATITTKLVTRAQAEYALLTELSCRGTNGVLVEFPGVLLATFMPILKSLQAMQTSSYLPFSQWILPERTTTPEEPAQIPQPGYARDQNYFFPLDSILKKKGDRLSFMPSTFHRDTTIIQELEMRTTLDSGQCQALAAALTREYAFIQGPPGTGKSYIGIHLMKVLLACKEKSKLGPIIVVCYTNHALDQFLEELVKVGVKKIIRIGGQSKSKILEGHNLRLVSKGEGKTGNELFLIAKTYRALENNEPIISSLLRSLRVLRKEPSWKTLKGHIEQTYPRIFKKFARLDKDEFELVGKEPFDVWSQKAAPKALREQFSADEEAIILQSLESAVNENIFDLSIPERRLLIEFWAREVYETNRDQLFELVNECCELHERLDKIHDESDRRVLENADVIGVTTTGLAKRISVLRHLRSKVIICEEAGEVMEPHMVSALLPNVEHFIQIGDHQQLRPQINNYKLSLESKQGGAYQLDRSQFERLSVGEPGRVPFPVAQLDTQRRMRPEISSLIRMTLYPRLVDHPSTMTFPDVFGMRNNVFWLDHENMENSPSLDRHQKSYSNDWEVDMTQSLVRHIVRQGVYDSKDIAVLTPYTGQLQKLRIKLRNDFEIVLSDRDLETLAKDGFDEKTSTPTEDDQKDVAKRQQTFVEKKKLSEFLRVATVDNFQGEESKIVIISLVRSNKEKKVGFLRTTNRINVLLSRAQHGMYLIGNADTYSNIPMWAKVIGMLEANHSVGKRIGLCCPRHMYTVMQVSEPLDFEKLSPEGGCQLPCDRRLAICGHKCLARCHSDTMHQVFQCPQPCQRLHSPCNHGCQKQTCGEDCGRCMIRINNVLLPCGHSKDGVSCYRTQDVGSIQCSTRVQKQVAGCNHVVEVPCFRDVSSKAFLCPTACEASLLCGHRCPGSCGKCHNNEHQKCKKICGRRFGTCNHTCPRTCHDGTDCGPCLAPCEVKCSHSQCTLRCHEPCAPCIESCTWSCEHQGTCEMPCAAPCDRLPCNERCSKDLSCGHQCPGICGEDCAEGYCQKCSTKLDARVDFVEMKSYEEIDVSETPIVVLGCGHFFTTESVDCLMNMGEVYKIDANGEFTGLKDISTNLAQSTPFCPDCKCPVRQFATQRYNRVVNRAVIDEMSKRFLSSGKDGLQELERQIDKLENWQRKTRENVMKTYKDKDHYEQVSPRATAVSTVTKLLHEGYEKSRALNAAVRKFCINFADKCQPAQKLHEAIVHAARKAAISKLPPDTLLANLRISDEAAAPTVSRDSQITMGGRMALIKADFLIIDDKFFVSKVLKSTNLDIKPLGKTPDKLAILFFRNCEKFITECDAQNLPKLAVEASVLFASLSRSFEDDCRSSRINLDTAKGVIETAKGLLEKALETCQRPFYNVEGLRVVVEQSINSMKREWYEEVTSVEKEAIKAAMLSGPRGIATHSGHWYNCSNGHPFVIGECGMPMELARCPECGASIGGRHHTAVQGVTRATEMED
ncbi:NFX1-type zinc finger-containing protein 1 [Nannizzia gypsea CBS 118893]|uniref:NFX1-type zinc finger-containing protein 1 n=1 Tax=Arthroderma gypseum (strain ATCC MYA-4604 / CBS 118893) TaxID=535722 RepID=E4UVT5_ARTGP|nr:NFX1-type zinc finger-containing protein 1 [Nannizzia gypsea CBS 118893]EFR02412.1 NFX1-type zinc finger-containing protein 1 [Nannizzia gypsea CBS 118893]